MVITSSPVKHKSPSHHLVRVTLDDGQEVVTFSIEMNGHHILSATYKRTTKDGLLLSAKVGVSLPRNIHDAVSKWYWENRKK